MTNRAAARIVPPQSRGYAERSNRGVLFNVNWTAGTDPAAEEASAGSDRRSSGHHSMRGVVKGGWM
jgi:hypothetical protein